MENVNEYIESGIVEAYVMGMASVEQCEEIENLIITNVALKNAINEFSHQLEEYALKNPVIPDPIVKPMVMASFDFMQRFACGETPSFPPILNEHSKIEDYQIWLQRSDMIAKPGLDDVYAKIIGFTPEVTTAIVWLKDMAPQEVHDHEYERFLIVEGTCNIIVGSDIHSMKPGDYFQIPLHTSHVVKVTSSIACKVILQRVAA